MSAEERQALREKHHKIYEDDDDSFCVECYTPYPCDVIKLLDATENLKPNDLKTKVECKHLKSITVPERQGFKETIKFTYCPKCGEKL